MAEFFELITNFLRNLDMATILDFVKFINWIDWLI